MSKNVAIAHDQIVAKGGAEHVAFEMARTLDAPIYAAAVDQNLIPPDVDVHCFVDSRAGQYCMDSHYLLQDAYQMQRWQCVRELHEYDCVLLNKTNPGWYVPKDTQATAWFVHSTPRGQYDQFHTRGRSFISRVLKTPMRVLYRPNVAYGDAFAANSDLVQRRMQRYWDIPPQESDVIYPPVHTNEYGPKHADEQKDYYFTFGRLHGHKRTHDIISAFNDLGNGYQLVVGGDGPDRGWLDRMAGDNADVVGFLDESEKRRRLAECKAFIFAAENEDFGLTPIEAMAAGTPVIGVDDGFTRHQITDGQNGILFERGQMQQAIRYFEHEGVAATPEELQTFADQFNADRFRDGIGDLVSKAMDKAHIQADINAPTERTAEAPNLIGDGSGGMAQLRQEPERHATMHDRLNLGCGEDYRDGWLNVDSVESVSPDLVHDLDDTPWPLPDANFKEVEMSHVLEHLHDTESALRECERVMEPGGVLCVKYPIGLDWLTDPDHSQRQWGWLTPELYCGKRHWDIDVGLSVADREVRMWAQDPGWLKKLREKWWRLLYRRYGPGRWCFGRGGMSGEMIVEFTKNGN